MGSSNTDSLFLKEISATDPVHDKKRILMLKGPLLWDSFNWIFGHPEFNEWRHTQENGVFWIKGDPGKGKTMLLCGIIEDLEKDSAVNLSYFFCQATDYRINTAAAVVGGLIKTLLKSHPRILSHIREKYEDGPKGQLEGANALVILCEIFEIMVKDLGLTDVICVVDALDECIKDCRYLLNLIIRTSSQVKWLISSRNEKDIEKGLDQVPQRLILELKENAEQISTSIDAYIRHHIREIDSLRNDSPLQEKTLRMLKSKAQGTFLWVALVVEQLHWTDRWEVENVLEEVPKDLENLYGLILDRWEKLGQKGREVCQVLLSIVITAKRPLRLEELLIFINSHWKDAKNNKSTYELRDIQDMTKTCGSILSIRDDTVYFIHQSAKDYIMENAAHRIFPIQRQHYKMFEASLDAMSNVLEYNIYGLEDPAIHIDDVPLKDIGSDPLVSIRYCCVFWVEHLVSGYHSERFEYNKYLNDNERLHNFLMKKFLCWIESLSLIRSFPLQAQIALQKLRGLIDCYCSSERNRDELSQATQLQRERETQGLSQFTDDAYSFVVNCKESVASWPLQLYFSAIAFEHGNNIIRRTFERTVRDRFGPSPTLASNQREQPSLRLQSSFRVSKFPEASPLFFSPDSSLIGRFCEIEDTQVLNFWTADSGILHRTFQIDGNDMIAFLPNSQDFISVSRAGIITKWNFGGTSCIGMQSLNLDSNADLEFNQVRKGKVIALSPNGDFVASFHVAPRKSNISNVIKVWDTDTARCCWYFKCDEEFRATTQGKPLFTFSFSPNSQLAALSDIYGTKILDATTGATVRYLKNPQSDLLEHASKWRPNFQHSPVFVVQAFHVSPILRNLLFSPNSKILVIEKLQRQLCLWDTSTWELMHVIELSPERVLHQISVAITPDSAILATSAGNGTQLWDTSTGECVANFPASSSSVAFAPGWAKSSVVALQQEPEMIHTGVVNISQTVSGVHRVGSAFYNVVISPDSRFVASRRRHLSEIYIWSGDDGHLIHVLQEAPPSDYPPIFSLDSKLLAHHSGTNRSDNIQIWSVLTGKLVRLLKGQGNASVSSVSFSSDPKHLIAGTFEHKIYIWRIDSGQLLHKFDFHNLCQMRVPGDFLVAISSDSAQIAAAYQDAESLQARIWHLHTGKRVVIRSGGESVTNYSTSIYASSPESIPGKKNFCFSSDSTILASITEYRAQIFSATTGACLQSFALDSDGHLRSVYFDPMKGRILTIKSMFYKTTSWKHWWTSPRSGYSYDHPDSPLARNSGAWILLDGKNNCYVPNHFRPRLLPGFNKFIELDLSDSLLAVVTGLGEVVIIKFPTWNEAREQTVETSDGISSSDDIPTSSGTSSLTADARATKKSGSRVAKRKSDISDETSVGDRSRSKVKGKRKTEKEQAPNEDWRPRRSGRIEIALRAKEAEKKP
nr:hypothetical protein [Trichoderma harzianum]